MTIDPSVAARRQRDQAAARRRRCNPPEVALPLVLGFGFAGALVACNTTQGVGEDVSAAGDALATGAEKNKAY